MNYGYRPPSSRPGFTLLGIAVVLLALILGFVAMFYFGFFMHGD